MIDVRINEDGTPAIMFLYPHELIKGRHLIYMGGNIEGLSIRARLPLYEVSDKIKSAPSPGIIVFEDYLVPMLIHETVHIVVFKMTGSLLTTRSIDRIDSFPSTLFHPEVS